MNLPIVDVTSQGAAAGDGGPVAEMPPRATVRLQMHAGFTLDQAREQVDYHAKLGFSHYYLSPIFTAREGSTHGYDIVDFGNINPEIGGRAALERLVETLRAHSMGLVIDIVPNHMSVHATHNAWWRDVLRHGRNGPHAKTFDIDWDAPGLDGRLLLPILGDQYGKVLRAGEIKVEWNDGLREFEVVYYDSRLPLADSDQQALQEAAERDGRDTLLTRFDGSTHAGRAQLGDLLERQNYRLAWWRTAADEINWRRFFEISDLVGLRIERREVFEATHALTFELYRKGLIDGVRVDHVDGLADPAGYCQALRERLTQLHGERPASLRAGRPWIVVEKILADHETMPVEWQTDGTTGYDYMNDCLRVLHDAAGETPLTALWNLSVGRNDDFDAEQRMARRQILTENLVSEFQSLVRRVRGLAQTDPMTRDITTGMIDRALGMLLEYFPVYRTYIVVPGQRSAQDVEIFQRTLSRAHVALRDADEPVLDLLEGWLGAEALGRNAGAPQAATITKFQQLTSPLAAKSVEDTAFYRYNRMISLNEVGGDPGLFSLSAAEFIERQAKASQEHPHRMLTTATHDHKRGPGVRTRLAVLSELPSLWAETLTEWRNQASVLRLRCDETTAPSTADEIALFQTLVGAWPNQLQIDDDAGVEEFLERVHAWQIKAVREAKQRSNWVAPHEAYEQACHDYLMGLANVDAGGQSLLSKVADFAHTIASAGALNSLAQSLITLTLPGVPDYYQGTEWWDFSLVDPDNRREVDYAARRDALERAPSILDVLPAWRDGRIKQALIRAVLSFRAREPELFSAGELVPLEVVGEHASRVLAYARQHADSDARAIVVTARLSARWLLPDSPHVAPMSWGDTRVVVPDEWLASDWYSLLDQRPVASGAEVATASEARTGAGSDLPGSAASADPWRLSSLLAKLPIALLVGDHSVDLEARAAAEAAAVVQAAAAVDLIGDGVDSAAPVAVKGERKQADPIGDPLLQSDLPGASARAEGS